MNSKLLLELYEIIFRTLLFTLSARRYITGTIIKVKNVAKVNPKITVQAIGPQKVALSPPKKICASNSVRHLKPTHHQCK